MSSTAGRPKSPPAFERIARSPRELKPVDEMIRFVVGPAGEVVPDVKRKLPGRGIWITATRAAVDEAVKRNVFARGFKRDVRVQPILPRRPNTCSSARRSTRWRSPAKPAAW